MIESLNGLIVDVRSQPKEIAFEKGLIPYLPET
jgi:hypothetical protein